MNQVLQIGNVISAFPAGMIELAGSYDDDNSGYGEGSLTQIINENKDWVEIRIKKLLCCCW